MARTGRPSKLTKERRDLFVTAIREGNYVEVAAAVAGIDRSTVYHWLAKGREARRGEFRDFFDAVKEAEAFAERTAVGQVRRAGATDTRNWAAAMTFLERRFRDRWGRPAAAAPGSPDPASLPGPPDLTDEPVIIPVAARLTGILDALAAAGKLDGQGDGTNGSGPPTVPVRGGGGGPAGNGTG